MDVHEKLEKPRESKVKDKDCDCGGNKVGFRITNVSVGRVV